MIYRDHFTRFVSSLRNSAMIDKIRAFGQLPEGWHCGEGVAPSPDVIGDAIRISSHAGRVGFDETNAFAGINGEVRITVYRGDNYLEFTVEPDRSITVVRERAGAEIDSRSGVGLDDALSILNDCGRDLWASFGFSTTGTTITDLDDFRRLRSETLRTVPEFLW